MNNLLLLLARAILSLSFIVIIAVSMVGCVGEEPRPFGEGKSTVETAYFDGEVTFQVRIATKRVENAPAVDESTPPCEVFIYSPDHWRGIRQTIEPMDVCKLIPRGLGNSYWAHYCYYQGDIILEDVQMLCGYLVSIDENVVFPDLSHVKWCQLAAPFLLKFNITIGDIECIKCEKFIHNERELFFKDYTDGERFLDEIDFDDYLEECEQKKGNTGE